MKCPHVTKSESAGDEHGWCVVCLRAEVKDLKARLKVCRVLMLQMGEQGLAADDVDWSCIRVTDLRVKNWREP